MSFFLHSFALFEAMTLTRVLRQNFLFYIRDLCSELVEHPLGRFAVDFV